MPKPAKFALPAVAFGGLLQDTTPGAALAGARLLPLALVDPNPTQSRQVFDATALAELADSIRLHGVLEPILVRPVGGRYQVVAGERRTRAAHAAGLVEIPALIRDLSDADAAWVTALENLQREDLDIEDEARQYDRLLELTGLTQPQLAAQLGIRVNYLSERVRILTYPDLMAGYRERHITWKQAMAAIAERRQGAPDYSGNIADTDSTLVERADLPTPNPQPPTPNVSTQRATRNTQPPVEPQYFRWVTQAFKAINHIQPQIIAPDERPLWAQQLAELEQRARELRQALESEAS